ncbi:MAG: bile acid:sodium symporter family protein [Planctomycetes bacterium]|nr:bile acid:sodium symporter family protein [Planctomycetota bacterium]
MLERFLLLWLTLLSLAALYWTSWTSAPFDPFVASKPYLSCMIAVTMFAIGSLLPHDEIQQVLRRWPTVLGGTAIQYISMPLLAYGIGHAFQLEQEMLIGVVMVGCVPGAMASNVLTLAARGNVSYSVSLTTSATLLSPLVVPFALWLTLGTARRPDPWEISRVLVLTVVGPVIFGHVLCRTYAKFERRMRVFGPIIANLTILWIIAVVVGLNRDRLSELNAVVLVVLLIVNLLGYTTGYFGSKLLRLPESMRRALTLEVGMQNAGLGTVLALGLFPESPAVAIPTAAYTFGCMLTGTVLAQWWAGKSVSEEEREAVPVAE